MGRPTHLPVRYAVLQTQYQALQLEMLDYKTKAHYWQAQFSQFKSREDLLKTEVGSAYRNTQNVALTGLTC